MVLGALEEVGLDVGRSQVVVPRTGWDLPALLQEAEEVGPLFGQRPHALTQGMHESEVLEVRQAEPHAMPDYVVLLFGFWWVFQPQKVFRDPQQLAKTPVKRIEMCTAI